MGSLQPELAVSLHRRTEREDIRGRLRSWWIMLRVSLEERLVYRGDFALGTLMRFLPIITQIFLWWAIYENVQSDSGEARLGGFRFPDMVAYFLLTMVGRAFSSMPGLASGIARQIRSGEIKKFLVQPVDLIGFLLLGRVAHKLAYYTVATLPFALVFFLCRHFFVDGWPSWERLIAFAMSLVLAFVIGFFLEAAIGMIGFWFLEVSSLLFLYMLFSFFLSGHMFPITMLPESFAWFVNLLPLKYLAYFPAAVFLGQIPDDRLWLEVGIELIWAVSLIGICRLMYAAGVRRYSGYGG